MRSPLAFVALLASLAVPAGAVHAAPCVTHLREVGPIDPANGFPKYYIDANGIALQPCLDFVCDPALAVPDPLQPVAFPGNFPVEFFYNRAIATITGPGTIKATYVAALEGGFLNGNVAVDGDQMVFTRIRIRVQGLTPGKSYTVTHPYGTNVYTSDGAGTINDTQDVGNAPGLFDRAVTQGNVGPFLTFLAGPVPPAPGLFGNPAADQTVTGGCNANVFRVAGTGLPGGKIETNLFNPVIGREVSVCGNGIVDFGEDCDDGNTLDGDCCSSTCKFEASGSTCDDGNPCTDNANGCDGAGVCTVTGFPTGPCDDGNACTVNESCDGAGNCVGVVGPPPVCPTITIDADVTAKGDSAKTAKANFGTATTVSADAKPQQITYYRATVTGLGAHAAGSAKLRLVVSTASKVGGDLHVVPDCTWTEKGLTFNNKPAFSPAALSSLGKVAVKKTVEFEIGSALNAGDGAYCFALTSSSSSGVGYRARENKTGKPTAAVLNVDGCACVP